MTATADARALRDLVDDLADRLEKTGIDDTGLGPAYMRISLRDAKSRAEGLIGTLEEITSEAEADAREAREDARTFSAQVDTLTKCVSDLEAKLAEKNAVLEEALA